MGKSDLRNLSTPENRKFWKSVDMTSKIVRAYPPWKRLESCTEERLKEIVIELCPFDYDEVEDLLKHGGKVSNYESLTSLVSSISKLPKSAQDNYRFVRKECDIEVEEFTLTEVSAIIGVR